MINKTRSSIECSRIVYPQRGCAGKLIQSENWTKKREHESRVNAASTNEVNAVGAKTSIELLDDLNMPELEDIVYSDSLISRDDDDEDVGAEADMNNLDAFMPEEPKKVIHALKDPSWIEAMQEELLQFKLKENLEAIRLFLAYALFKDLCGVQDGCSRVLFFYGKIKAVVYVCQPLGFEAPDFNDRVLQSRKKELYGTA
ncbi:hypothetical protein Tco_0911034 [Tanacetum coccineum]|uniref:Reverse transcriptase n=1 Tax=Tanacetum coccineum TaxID=301880 RepID=A0ABQ5D1Q5_9ASTR